MQALRDLYKPRKGGGLVDGPKVGVEIEVEGAGLVGGLRGFRCERDGSLRGENVEYVFEKPVEWKDEGYRLVKTLRLKLKQAESVVYDTGYAGIHVHVNVCDMTPIQLWRYAIAYYIAEPLLLEFCGEDRRSNLFCLSLQEAVTPLRRLREAIERLSFEELYTDDIRYAALNFKALAEYGSFEFRAMRSVVDETVLNQWVTMLLELRQFALGDWDVRSVIQDLSIAQEGFLKALMPTSYVYLADVDDKFDKMLEGLRTVQYDIAIFDEEKCKLTAEHRIKRRAEDAAANAMEWKAVGVGIGGLHVAQPRARANPARFIVDELVPEIEGNIHEPEIDL